MLRTNRQTNKQMSAEYTRRSTLSTWVIIIIIIIIIIRSAHTLAPSAFLASAASTHDLQQSMHVSRIHRITGRRVCLSSIETRWTSLSTSQKPAAELLHIQTAWDRLVAEHHEGVVWSHATTDIDKARLLAASSPHLGDWLAAPPITAVGLRLTDEEIRVSVAHRLGCKA